MADLMTAVTFGNQEAEATLTDGCISFFPEGYIRIGFKNNISVYVYNKPFPSLFKLAPAINRFLSLSLIFLPCSFPPSLS